MERKQHTKGFKVKMPSEAGMPSSEKKQAEKMMEKAEKMPVPRGESNNKPEKSAEAAKIQHKASEKISQGESLMDVKAMVDLVHPARGQMAPAVSKRPANHGPFSEMSGKMQGEAKSQKDYQAAEDKLQLVKVKKKK